MVAAVSLTVIFTFYFLLNLGRLLKKRVQADYLRRSFWRTAISLAVMTALTITAYSLAKGLNLSLMAALYGLAGGELVAAGIILASTVRHLKTTHPIVVTEGYTANDLPTVSVCVPARNETEALKQCLESLVASNYPKLEILVLDDCSQSRQTSEIIRGFAQSGVQFVAGKVTPGRWLAKNYAYQQLAEAANGEVLLFCGVDTRFEPDSLSALVKIMLEKRKTMLSVIPRNLTAGFDLKQLLVQPGRYSWELALPRRLAGRPPVLSTCWLVKRQALEAAGGFAAVARKCVPESYFAKAAAGKDDGYSFLQGGGIGLTSNKSFEEQQATALRTRYPQQHRRPEMVALTSLAELTVLVLPFTLLVAAVAAGIWPLAALSAVVCGLLTASYALIVKLAYQRFFIRSLWFLPFAALYDIGLLNYSMWQYEFGEVIWKGRNVCLPIMRATSG